MFRQKPILFSICLSLCLVIWITFLAACAPVTVQEPQAIEPATPTPEPAAAWVDRLLGVRTAYAAPAAHNVPSDWWRVPVTGGAPERLTQIFDTGLHGAAAPGGGWAAFISASGLYVMQSDGGNVTRLSRQGGTGTVEWLAP